MNRKFTFLTELKKYSKIICLLLLVLGAAVMGVNAQECSFPANYTHPLKKDYSPITGGKTFGASRSNSKCSNGRVHAGIDFVISKGAGTPVYACAPGL